MGSVNVTETRDWSELYKAVREYGPLSKAFAALGSCVGKTPYTTKGDAMRVLGFRLKRGQPLHAYRCEHCKQWHLGR